MIREENDDWLPISVAAVAPTPVENVAVQVRMAREAHGAWAALSFSRRRRLLRRVSRRLLANAELLAETAARETKMSVEEVFAGDVLPTAGLVAAYSRVIDALLETSEFDVGSPWLGGTAVKTRHVSRGVVAVVTASASPVLAPFRFLVAALLAGDVVVWKASASTPRTAALLVSFFEGVLPASVVTLLQGGDVTGTALLASDVDAVLFAGEEATGRHVAEMGARRGLPYALELARGGVAVVLADAPLERTAEALVVAAMSQGGRLPGSLVCAYVERPIAGLLLERAIVLAETWRSQGRASSTLAVRGVEAMRARVERAVKDGGEILFGELSGEGPMVVRLDRSDLDATPLVRDPVPFPILTVVVVEGVDEAIVRLNEHHRGRTVSFWTSRGRGVAAWVERLQAEVVTINQHPLRPADPPADALEPWAGTTRGDPLWGALLQPRLWSVTSRKHLENGMGRMATGSGPDALVSLRARAVLQGSGRGRAWLRAYVTLFRQWLKQRSLP